MRNMKGELLCFKEEIKPNFSELARIYKIDRRTIKILLQFRYIKCKK